MVVQRLLVVVALVLAGCSSAPEPTADAGEAEDEPGRVARGADERELDEETELEPVSLLLQPLSMLGPGEVGYEAEVPPGLALATFEIRSQQALHFQGLRVELEGCGSHTNSGVFGSTGTNAGYWSDLCEFPAPGATRVTVAADLAVVEGTFELIGWRPVDEYPEPGNGTAGRAAA